MQETKGSVRYSLGEPINEKICKNNDSNARTADPIINNNISIEGIEPWNTTLH